jgi:hypothetical protein
MSLSHRSNTLVPNTYLLKRDGDGSLSKPSSIGRSAKELEVLTAGALLAGDGLLGVGLPLLAIWDGWSLRGLPPFRFWAMFWKGEEGVEVWGGGGGLKTVSL